MSKDRAQPTLIVEWSADSVTLYDAVTKKTRSAPKLSDLIGSFGSGREVVLALSRNTAYVKAIRVPDAPKEDVRQALTLSLGQHFPIVGSEMAFDFRLTDDKTQDGRLAIVCGVRAEHLKSATEQLAAVGLKPAVVLPSAFGSQLLTRSLNLNEAAVMFHTAEGLAVDVVEGGELRYSRLVHEGVAAPTYEMEAAKTLAAAGVACAPIVAAGGLPDSDAEYLTPTIPLDYFATPEAAKLGISIELPAVIEDRKRKKHAQQVRFAALLWGAAVLLAALVYFDRADASAKVEHLNSLHRSEFTKLKSLKTKAQTESSDAKSLNAAVERAFKPAQTFGDVVSVITNDVPKGVWLTGISLERGKPMLIRGSGTTSQAVANFVSKLTTEKRFRDVKLVFANNAKVDETIVVLFSISGFPVGNLPLLDTDKQGAKK